MLNYQEYLDSIDRKAYHEGEWRWEEDGYTVTRTYPWSAPGCHDSCGILYYTKDGKLERVEGDPLDPWAGGKLCMRCLSMPESVYSEHRLKYPVKRAGERGQNKWERITWDEALDMIADYVHNEIDAKGYGRESILVNHGTGRNISTWIPFLAGACLGTASCGGIYFSGWWCYLPRVLGSSAMFGDYLIVDAAGTLPDRYANPDWVNPDVLIVWGNEPLKSNADAFLGHWLNVCVQMGTKIISIDPLLTWWGARAEYFLQVRPGTDVCLSLAMLHVICGEDLVDHEFIDLWCWGYEELAEHVKQFTPEWAAERCGLDAADIVGAARMYATAERGAIQWGLAFDASTASSLHWTQCVAAMMAICGNVEKPGTHVIVHNAFEVNAGYTTIANYARKEALENKPSKKLSGLPGVDFMPVANVDSIATILETGEPYPFLMYWAESSNALSGHEAQAPRAYEFMRKIPFIVYADPFITPSAVALADLVLPVAMSVERDSCRAWWSPLRAIKKSADTYGEAKSDEEIIMWLGKRMNPELFSRWETTEDLINEYMLNGLNTVDEEGHILKQGQRNSFDPRMTAEDKDLDRDTIRTKCPVTFDQLVKQGGHLFDEWNATYYKHEKGLLRPDGKVGFNTPTGRIELLPTAYAVYQISTLPEYTPVSVGRDSTPELLEEYPYYFINGNRSYEYFHTEQRWSETSREFHPEPIVRVSPNTAAKYDLHDGDWLWMENKDGRCMQMVEIFPGISDECVQAEHGWWKPEAEGAEPCLFNTFEYNPNNLTHNFESGPGGIGAPPKAFLCKIYKVTPENAEPLPGRQVTRLGGFRDDYQPTQP